MLLGLPVLAAIITGTPNLGPPCDSRPKQKTPVGMQLDGSCAAHESADLQMTNLHNTILGSNERHSLPGQHAARLCLHVQIHKYVNLFILLQISF